MIDVSNADIDVEATLTLGSYKGEVALNLTISDITLRKELEKRLTDSERLFRNVVNSMVDALVITDLQGRVLDVNEEFERLTGFRRVEALNASIPYPWIDEEGLRIYMAWLEGLRSHSELRDFDITWVNKAGKKIDVSLNTTLLHNSTGDPILMVNIARDITDRQTARTELNRQVRRLEALYELSKMLGGTLDPVEISRITFRQLKKVIPTDSFYIDLYNDIRQEVRWLYLVDIIEGKQIELKPPEDPLPLSQQAASWNVITKKKPLLELRKEIPDKPRSMPFGDVNRASASLMHVPMFSKDRIIGIMSVQSYEKNAYSRDQLTLLESIASVAAIAIEKASLYQETVEKSTEIEARNKELDDFTYVVSHDLKEPLISVEGYAKIIRQEYSASFDEPGKEYIRSIVDSCAHMKRLIEDLLQLSRVSKLAETRTPIDLYSLIQGILEEMQYTLSERHAVIEIQPTLPKVIGVDQHLRIVFRNLLSNGVKFCDKAVPRITISWVPRGQLAEIVVSDNGIGIEEEYFERIFMIFQRLHNKEEYEGTGAGLTIVRKIIEGLGGQIWVTSKKGEGTTFHFTLPTS
jgi:PAS domain S-box-containing protein